MKRLLICAVLLAAGCSNSPTSPSVVRTLAPGTSNLRWDVVAPGCVATAPPVPLPDPSTANIVAQPDGSILASWPYTSGTGRPVTLYARFVERGGALALCSWDTADV